MMAKIVIVLTLFVVITEARFLDRERDFFQDTSKRSGTVAAAPIPWSGQVSIERVGEDPGNECSLGETRCSNDSECRSLCGNRAVICNFMWRCNYSSPFDNNLRNKPCYSIGLFKKRCKSNDDCLCNERNGLVCEDNECVEPRRTNKTTVYRHRL